MSAESEQRWPFFPVNLSPAPLASSTVDPSLLNQLNGTSCYLPLPPNALSSPSSFWPTCPTCDLPLFFVAQLSALDPSTPEPVRARLTLPSGPLILQLFTCRDNCAVEAIIQAESSDSPAWENEWRDERVLRFLRGPFVPPPVPRGRMLTLGEMATEVFISRLQWKKEIGRVPSHFQELVEAHRATVARREALEKARAVGAGVGSDIVEPGKLETVYPRKWVKGKYYEEEWDEGPYSKRAYREDGDEDPTFGPTNALKLLGFPTKGKYTYMPSRCAATTSKGEPCTAPQSCLMFLAGNYGDAEPELPDGEVVGIPKYPCEPMGDSWVSQCDEHLDQVWLNVTGTW